MNKQREVIYGFRNEIINGDDVRDRLMDIMEEVVIEKVRQFTPGRPSRRMESPPLADWVNLNFPLGMPEEEILKAAESGKEKPVSGSLFDGLSPAQFAVCNFISDSVRKAYDSRSASKIPTR
jgi:preprotein translocase subunit SecA